MCYEIEGISCFRRIRLSRRLVNNLEIFGLESIPEKKIWTQELLKIMYPVNNKNLVSACLYNLPQCGRQYSNKELHRCVLQGLKTRRKY